LPATGAKGGSLARTNGASAAEEERIVLRLTKGQIGCGKKGKKGKKREEEKREIIPHSNSAKLEKKAGWNAKIEQEGRTGK